MTARAYYAENSASAAFYDVVSAADPSVADDVERYAALIPPGGSVLELGSGTGRISKPLAERGVDVVGLEIAPEMLRQAQSHAHGVSGLRYVYGDMRAFELMRDFDAVICPFNALAHLPPAEWASVMACTAHHLRSGGLAAFHMPIATQLAAPGPPCGALVFKADDFCIRLAEKRFDHTSGRMDLTLDYVAGEAIRTETLTLYAGSPAPAAKAAGLVSDGPPQPRQQSGELHVYRKR